MPNANEVIPSELGHNILLLGYVGSGKTAQLLTLPGKTFCYIFDPSSLHTLAGHDIDYELFIPTRLNIAAQSLTKEKSDKAFRKTDVQTLYTEFADDLDEKIGSDFFKDYNNVVLDSFTTFSDAVLDRVMYLNGRLGQQPHQDDYGAQMATIKSVLRELMGLRDTSVVCIGHVEFKQEEESGRMQNVIRLTGILRTIIPTLFSDILYCDVKVKGSENTFVLRTKKDKHNPQVRCTLRDKGGNPLKAEVEVEIPPGLWADPRGKCGLGRLILEHAQSE